MIVWLNVPFAQKDAAKRLGARWSAAEKKWYVQDVENLAPFLRWIDDRLKQPTKSQPPKTSQPGRQRKKSGAPKHGGSHANLAHMKRIAEWRKSKPEQVSVKGVPDMAPKKWPKTNGKQYRDDGIKRDWAPWEDGPDAVAVEFSDEAIGDKLRGL